MGAFKTWFHLQEDNARKRAVRKALAGTGVPLPGSAAACPSTNAAAMDVAGEEGIVTKLNSHKKHKKSEKKTDDDDKEDDIGEAIRTPDYTVDAAIKKAEDLKSDLNKYRDEADKGEKELERKKAEIEKKGPASSHKDKDDESKTETPWDKYKKKHGLDKDEPESGEGKDEDDGIKRYRGWTPKTSEKAGSSPAGKEEPQVRFDFRKKK